ncbi:MAG: NAD(P)/FAD-dependent oxidoreductase [Clostridia bacterium]|nr:NAD(P)/FAD-dependent oxidoreductase [Clostridia bacterium]
MNKNHYDAIVVGAGPAGSVAALTLAKNNLSVALLERGKFPGSKNMFGGTIYRETTEKIFPAFWHDAPVERAVVRDEAWFMEEDSVVNMGFNGLRFAKEPYNKFTVLRAKFDKWMAEQARKAGVHLICGTLVRHVKYKGKKAIGVVLDDGSELGADAVVLAEGVTSLLTKEAKLRQDYTPHQLTLYAQEIMELDSKIIEERFNLEKDQGAIIGMLGYPTAGAIGKAGIWTNKNTLSMIAGGYLWDLMQKGLSPDLLLQRTKQHPLVKRLIQGAKVVQYKAHMIPKGGYKALPKLCSDGIVVVGDAAGMISGRRGTDLAMLTGQFGAQAIVQAKAKGDFTAKTLAAYANKVNRSFFLKDMKAGEQTVEYYHKNPDADYLLSKTLNDLGYAYFSEGLVTSREKTQLITNTILSEQPLAKTLFDLYNGYKYWEAF